MKITIPKYSIIVTVGPSNSGKSFLCKQLCSLLDKEGKRYKYISSDAERRDILSEELHKHDNKMMAASKGAFDLLHKKLDVYSSYPINIPYIIIDATNLSKSSRNEISEYAKKNHYSLVGLVFDYKDINDYFKYVDENIDKRIIMRMARSMRKEVIKEIDRSQFKSLNRITSIDFTGIEFEFAEQEKGYKIPTDMNYCVVGDIHGCYEELLEVLRDNKGITLVDEIDGIPRIDFQDVNNYVQHILIGDIIDKGPEEGVEKLIKFLHKNWNWFIMLEGNHERHVYQYLKGVIKSSAEENDLIDNYFTSVRLFERNEELKNMFFHIYENHMHTFVYNDKFIVTHAPCENKYLGKYDKVSLKKMNTTMYPKSKNYVDQEEYFKAMENFFGYLHADSQPNFPYHVFGHVMLKSAFTNRNKVGIDLGCVVGGHLGTATFMKDNLRPFIKKYKSKQPVTKELFDLFRLKQQEISIGSLDIDLQKRIKWCARNGVNFISGTMSPVNKHAESGDIESLAMGIKYYLDHDVTKIILEPKYMGSRANCKLHISDTEKCKMFSRNAYEITDSRLNSDRKLGDLYLELQTRYANLFKELDAEYILLDGELLPWNAMGKDLIERDFMVAYKACDSEHKLLRKTGFETVLNSFIEKYETFEIHYPKPHEERLKKEYDSFKDDILPIEVMQDCIDKYKHQLDLFGSDGQLEFKPFAILKTVKTDGTEENFISSKHSNLDMFQRLAKNEPYCFIDVRKEDGKAYISFDNESEVTYRADDDGYNDCLNDFWEFITEQHEMEGLVIKPDQAYVPGVAPFLKCRNKEYLRLTYGFEYDTLPVKTERLISKKSIDRKLKTSIKEYELGREILNVPMNEISVDNPIYVGLCVGLINEQLGETELDPRL